MNRRRVAVVVALLVAVLALARCGGDVVALGRTDLANSSQTFRNGSFLITVTGLAYAVQEIPVDAAAKSRGCIYWYLLDRVCEAGHGDQERAVPERLKRLRGVCSTQCHDVPATPSVACRK